MPSIRTKWFQEIGYSESSLFQFPSGLPGFEHERAFVFVDRPDSHPLMFMQSTATPDLCFVMLPVLVVDKHYQLSLDEEALAQLKWDADRPPAIGEDILCAVIVCSKGNREPATVNLLAPVVVNLRERLGIQAIQTQSGYSHRHPLAPQEELVPCS